MKERVSTYPGRVKLIPVEGQENIYDMERADNYDHNYQYDGYATDGRDSGVGGIG